MPKSNRQNPPARPRAGTQKDPLRAGVARVRRNGGKKGGADLLFQNLWTTRRTPQDAVPLGAIAAAMDRIAPPHLAEPWDNVGLLSGHADARVKKVLLSIDLTAAVYDEALRSAADLLILYHPPIFKPLKHLRAEGLDAPNLAVRLASHGVWVYSPHTALDTAPDGTNDVLAAAVGATVTGSLSLHAAQGNYLKLVTFVPEPDLEKVSTALFAAGCGHIGTKSKYTCCSFRTPGTGTFFGDDSTNPAVGQKGRLERVHEIRIETILPAHLASAAVAALRKAHPYEEPAFDLLQMVTPPEEVGLGRFAELDKPLTLAAFAERCKAALRLLHATVVGDPHKRIRTLGIVAGSCDRIPLEAHPRQPFDCVLTGELKHHHMLAYQAAGIAAVCLGHGNSERPVLAALRRRLGGVFPTLLMRVSRADRDPFAIV